MLARVCRAAWRLEQAGRERTWALVSARAEGISIRILAAAAGLSTSRVRQIVADADLDALDAALGERRAGPPPEDPDSGEDTELGGRDSIADRLSDEVSWLRQCADWLAHLDADSYPPAVSLRPSADWPDRAVVAAGLARVRASSTASPRWTSSPGPGGPRTWTPPRCCPTRGPNAAGGSPSRTWSSGPSAPGGGCPLPPPRNWRGPGTPGRPNGTARRDQPAARLHRQPVPAALTTRPPCPRSGNWTP